MYLPKHFKQTDIEEVKGLVSCFPLATCVANMGDEFEVNHFPMIWRDDQLIGHIAFANPMHKTLQNGCKVVFVLNAEDSYVTPNWCPNTAQQY